jgi:hypothetical protein
MSTSQHPIAVRLERLVGGSAALLATVMWLPLLDGIFPALVIAGTLDSVVGIVQVGLLVFGGSATLAVLLAEADGDRRESVRTVLLVGLPLIVVATVEAALAPTLDSALDLVVFERFAALVILAVAAKTASARIGDFLPRPAVIVGLGLLASVDPAGTTIAFVSRPDLVLRGMASATVGVTFALVVAIAAPHLRTVVHLDRFRFGSAVALGLLPLTFVGIDPQLWEFAPLAVLGLTTLFAFEPGGDGTVVARSHSQNDSERDPDHHSKAHRLEETAGPSQIEASPRVSVTDGGTDVRIRTSRADDESED